MIAGILNSLFGAILDIICCRFKLGQYKPSEKSDPAAANSSLIAANIPIPAQLMNLQYRH